MPHHSADVIREVLSLLDAGRSQGDVSRQTGIPQPTISRWVKQQHRHGSPAVHRRVHHGSPDIARQSDVDALNTRVEVLEAFIATLQQHQIPLPGSPNGSPVVHPVHSGSPTHKRGFVLADDLWDTIHSYADAHHWQIAQVVDVALRTFFAHVGQEVDADA